MKIKYNLWIENFVKENPKIKGLCSIATEQMVKEFPDLKRVRGHVQDALITREVEHWWCIDDENNIIDPTASQFNFIISYDERDESLPEPTGKCPNCGEYCFNNNFTCSDKCSKEYHAYVTSGKF